MAKPDLEQILSTTMRKRKFQGDWAITRDKIGTKIQELPFSEQAQAKKFKHQIIHKIDGFQTSAPFTIVRIAELLMDPEGQGYPLDSEINVQKYLNSLNQTVCVESSVIDFPEPTFEEPQPQQSSIDMNVDMVEIPWLTMNNKVLIDQDSNDRSLQNPFENNQEGGSDGNEQGQQFEALDTADNQDKQLLEESNQNHQIPSDIDQFPYTNERKHTQVKSDFESNTIPSEGTDIKRPRTDSTENMDISNNAFKEDQMGSESLFESSECELLKAR